MTENAAARKSVYGLTDIDCRQASALKAGQQGAVVSLPAARWSVKWPRKSDAQARQQIVHVILTGGLFCDAGRLRWRCRLPVTRSGRAVAQYLY